MSWLKNHLKRYGRLHLIAAVFIVGGIWQAVTDYQARMDMKADWQTVAKVLLFHSAFISLFFAMWAGRVMWLYLSKSEYAGWRKESKIFYASTASVIAFIATTMLELLVIVIYLEPPR